MLIRSIAVSCASWLRKALVRWWRACGIKEPIDYFYAAFLFLATLLIISMGPSLQTYASALLISSESNVYDSAYRDAIQKFPDFAGWLANTLDTNSIIASVMVWCTALATGRARTALVRSFVAAAVSLSILDIVSALFYDAFTFEYILTCLACNLIGGMLIALIIVSMRSAGTFVARFEKQSRATKIIGLCVPLIIGAVISGSVFIVAKAMYDPAPADFKARVSPESWGSYRTQMPGKEKVFRILEGQGTKKLVSWKGLSSPLVVSWNANNTPYKLDVFLSDGCSSESMKPRFLISSALTIDRVSSLNIKLDQGMSEYALLPGEEIRVSADDKDVAQFTIERKEGKAARYTLFTSKDSTLTYAQSGTKNLFVSNFLMDKGANSELALKAKTLTFVIDGRDYSITFEPKEASPSPSTLVSCSPIRAKFSKTRQLSVVSADPITSVVFTLTPTMPEVMKSFRENPDNKFVAVGANGWLNFQANNFEMNGESTFSEGKTDFLVLSGKFDEFQVANAAMPTSNVNSLQAFGGLTNVELDNDGTLHIAGKANALYWNQERVNKTRWEKIDIGWALLLLSWVAGLLVLSYKGVRAALSSNYELGTPN